MVFLLFIKNKSCYGWYAYRDILCIKMIVKRQRGSPVIYLFHGRQSEIIVLMNKNRKKTDYKTHEFSLGGLNVKAWICY